MSEIHEELSNIKTEVGILNNKMDNCVTQIQSLTQGIGARVQDHDVKIAKTEIQVENIEKYTNSISKNLKDHIDGHWKWIAIVIGLISIASFIMKQI